MTRRLLTFLVTTVAILVTGPVAGQSPFGQSPLGLTPTLSSLMSGVSGTTRSAITGQTLTGSRAPVPNAHVRLRDLNTGLIVGQTSTNHSGEFTFMLRGGGTFVPEVLEDTGDVLAVGDIVIVDPGYAVGALILLPARVPTFAGLFGSTAASIVQAAASAGISAVTAGDPLTPEE
jgi:hypothetical protein